MKKKKKVTKYITAFDPTIGKRVLYIVKKGVAKSVISDHTFNYKPKPKRKKKVK